MNDTLPGVTHAEGSAVDGPSAPNLVTIACPCEGTPHDEDTIILAPDVPLELGIAASSVIWSAENQEIVMGRLAPIFLRFGIIGWSLVDADGQPEALTPANVTRRLPYGKGGYEVVEAAARLYTDDLMRPLVAERARLLARGPQGDSISATNGSGRKRQKSSAPSSPDSTAGQPSAAPAP